MNIGKWLSGLLGRTGGRAVADSEIQSSSAHEHILKLRFYTDGRWTLNDDTVKLSDLNKHAEAAASNGGAVWVWSEGEMSETNVGVMTKLLDGANLKIAFSADEKFSSMPLPEDDDDALPSNVYVFNSAEELQQCVGNKTEFCVYLSSLQLTFDVYRSDKDDADKEDAGIFHIVGAVRPNASKFWFLHPGVHDDEYYQPLVELLEIQPLPNVKEGVLAFLISNKRPVKPDESPQFEVVIPDEWTEVPRSLGKEMTVTEILDVLMPR